MPTPPDFTNGTALDASSLNKIGQWLITTVSPTPATTIAVNGCFTSDYTNYTIIVTPIGLSGSSDITIRLRAGGTPSIVNYYLANIFADGASISAQAENNTANWRALNIGSTGTNGLNQFRFDLYGPAVAINTRYNYIGAGWSGTNVRYRSGMGFHDQTVAYDGFDLTASTTITATIAVYGYNNG
jgi:hypothetical protein